MDPARIVPDDQVWLAIKSECARAAAREPLLAGFLYATVLSQPDIEESLSYLLASKLDNSTLPALGVRVPQMICNSVDLPEPLRPTIPTTSPRATSKLMSCSALKTLK